MKNRLPLRIAAIGLSFFLGTVFSLSLATTASAATTTSTSTGASAICSPSKTTGVSPAQAASNYLPANRWLGALSTTHTDLSLGFNIGNDIAYAQRSGLISPLMSIGNAEWGLGISSTEFANNFCIQSTVSGALDSTAAKFDSALFSSGIIVIIIVIAILALLISKFRRGGPGTLSGLVKIVAVAAIFTLMIGSSSSVTPSNPNPMWSPSWILNTTYGAINSVISVPALGIDKAVSDIGINNGGQVTSDPLNCLYYEQALVDTYSGTKGGISAANGGVTGVTASYAAVPVSLNSLWEGLAVPTYVEEQLGGSNNFGSLTYCHLLEQNAGISPRNQLQLTNAGIAVAVTPGANGRTPSGLTNPSLVGTYSNGTVNGGILGGASGTASATSLAWNGAVTNASQDESMVGWAACQTNSTSDQPMEWDIQSGNQVSKSEWTMVGNTTEPAGGSVSSTATSGGGKGKPVVGAADCQAFFETPALADGGTTYGTPMVMASGVANSDYSVFNWNAATPANIASDTSGLNITGITGMTSGAQYGSGVADYLNNLHGTSNATAEAAAFLFVLSSTIITAVFFGLSLALIISKVALLILMMVLPIMLIFMLLPFANSEGKFVLMAKKTLSLIIFSTSVGLVLSIVSGISSMLASVGSDVAGPGSIFALLFTGLSPLVAVYVIHMFFKKVIKAPSPFTPKGMMGYAASAATMGAIGGAELEHHFSRAGRMKDNMLEKSGLGVLSKNPNAGRPGFSYGHQGRRGGMGGEDHKSSTGPAVDGTNTSDPSPPTGDTPVSGAPSTGDTPISGAPPTGDASSAIPTVPLVPDAGGKTEPLHVEPVGESNGPSASSSSSVPGDVPPADSDPAAGTADSPSPTETNEPEPDPAPRRTVRAASEKLLKGIKYIGPHPLEEMRRKVNVNGQEVNKYSKVGKVKVGVKKAAKYGAIGAVGLAALPAAGVGLAGYAAIAGGAMAAGAVGRKLHLRRNPDLGVRQDSTAAREDPVASSAGDNTSVEQNEPIFDPVDPPAGTPIMTDVPVQPRATRRSQFLDPQGRPFDVYEDTGEVVQPERTTVVDAQPAPTEPQVTQENATESPAPEEDVVPVPSINFDDPSNPELVRAGAQARQSAHDARSTSPARSSWRGRIPRIDASEIPTKRRMGGRTRRRSVTPDVSGPAISPPSSQETSDGRPTGNANGA